MDSRTENRTQVLSLENKYVVTGAALVTFLSGFLLTELVFKLLLGRI